MSVGGLYVDDASCAVVFIPRDWNADGEETCWFVHGTYPCDGTRGGNDWYSYAGRDAETPGTIVLHMPVSNGKDTALRKTGTRRGSLQNGCIKWSDDGSVWSYVHVTNRQLTPRHRPMFLLPLVIRVVSMFAKGALSLGKRLYASLSKEKM